MIDRQRGGTGSARRPLRADLRGPTEVLGTAARYLRIVAGAAVLVALVTAVLLPPDTSGDAEATARLGLTEAVVWPFYDAARDRQKQVFDDPTFRTGVAKALTAAGHDIGALTEFRLDVPLAQAFVDVVAVAPDAETARLAVNVAADELTSLDRQRVTASLQSQLDGETARLAELDARLKVLENQLATVVETEARANADLRTATGAQIEVADRTRLTAQLQRSAVEVERNAAVQERSGVVATAGQLRAKLSVIRPEVEVLRYQPATPAAGGSGRWSRAALAGLVALVVGAIVSVIWDAERGRVLHATQLHGDGPLDPLGEIVLDPVDGDRASVERALAAITLLGRTRPAGSSPTVGPVVSVLEAGGAMGSAAAVIAALVAGLADSGYVAASVGPGPAADGVTEFDPADAPRVADDAVDRFEGPVHVRWPDNGSRADLADVRDVLTALARRCDLVLVDCGSGLPSEPSRRARASSCEVSIVTALAGSTRVHEVRRRGELLPAVECLGVVVVSRAGGAEPASLVAAARTAWRTRARISALPSVGGPDRLRAHDVTGDGQSDSLQVHEEPEADEPEYDEPKYDDVYDDDDDEPEYDDEHDEPEIDEYDAVDEHDAVDEDDEDEDQDEDEDFEDEDEDEDDEEGTDAGTDSDGDLAAEEQAFSEVLEPVIGSEQRAKRRTSASPPAPEPSSVSATGRRRSLFARTTT